MTEALCAFCNKPMQETLLYYSGTPFEGPGRCDYITSSHGHLCKRNEKHSIDVLGPVHIGKPGLPFYSEQYGQVAIAPREG